MQWFITEDLNNSIRNYILTLEEWKERKFKKDRKEAKKKNLTKK